MGSQRVGKAQEQRGVLAVGSLGLGHMGLVIEADTDDLARRRDHGLSLDLGRGDMLATLLNIRLQFGQGLGPMPAITAVFLYSLLPIMRNTYLALTGVEPGIREAARGIGMTFGQRLRMVELPIAVPVILAGVRTAVVMNIGVMTIAATIGAGGLGVLILASISRSDMSMLIVGAVLVSLLAIFADLLLQWLQRSLTPKGLLK